MSILRNKKFLAVIIPLIVFVVALCVFIGINSDSKTYIETSALMVNFTADEMLEKSSLIIAGRLEKKTEPFLVAVNGSSQSAYTDYYFRPETVLRGEVTSEYVIVRIRGGEIGNMVYVDSFDPEFNTDDLYGLFLFDNNLVEKADSSLDYYEVLGGSQGVFKLIGADDIKSNTGDSNTDELKIFNSQENFEDIKMFANPAALEIYNNSLEEAENKKLGGMQAQEIHEFESSLIAATEKGEFTKEVFLLDDLSKTMESFNVTTPVDDELLYKEMMRNLKSNLETGFITQEEYDLYINQETREEIISDYTIIE